jgi:uncharacterized protein YjiS (DUF1127 family)
MGAFIRRWRQARRYRVTLQRLQSLSSVELHELGIAPWDIDRLARKSAQT